MSREKILAAVKANQPAPTELPAEIGFPAPQQDLVVNFISAVQKAGGDVIEVADINYIPGLLADLLPQRTRILNTVNDTPNRYRQYLSQPALLELVVMKGQFGVAENGAIWLTEAEYGQRVLPFIAQHLALVISRQHLVANMHQAYQVIGQDLAGFGVFIAGPSKTADIEQSLVIGAHGARSLLVFLTDN
ncbi:MAG: LUD domain-containing protein [Candidatus Pseudobacter hemicellulosilyticus]|uniref:LUD domain-containing protein n=1 Tax=Candidatus Pseudobacter hemicellulosilyticus TaxID=3121375 RepID=A0AAJ5WKT2_9BACT|nr:MAG: LUD domain-containing protein [Pseudobacter sp.]